MPCPAAAKDRRRRFARSGAGIHRPALKVFAVIALIIVGGAAWVVYEQRQTLLEEWLTPDTPELKTDAVPGRWKSWPRRPTPIWCRSGQSILPATRSTLSPPDDATVSARSSPTPGGYR